MGQVRDGGGDPWEPPKHPEPPLWGLTLPLSRSLYPPITSDGTRQKYKQEFDTDLKRYKQLCAEMDGVNDRLNQLSKQLDSISEDSPKYQVRALRELWDAGGMDAAVGSGMDAAGSWDAAGSRDAAGHRGCMLWWIRNRCCGDSGRCRAALVPVGCPPAVTPPPTPFPSQDVAEEYNRLKDLKRVSVRSAAGLSFQLKWDWVGAM